MRPSEADMKAPLLIVVLAGACVALAAASADAAPKGKKQQRTPDLSQRPWAAYVDPRLGPFGPNNTVIFSNRVIGTDPDPNIRAAILKDISGYFGGGR
jgi:hypothetical protein